MSSKNALDVLLKNRKISQKTYDAYCAKNFANGGVVQPDIAKDLVPSINNPVLEEAIAKAQQNTDEQAKKILPEKGVLGQAVQDEITQRKNAIVNQPASYLPIEKQKEMGAPVLTPPTKEQIAQAFPEKQKPGQEEEQIAGEFVASPKAEPQNIAMQGLQKTMGSPYDSIMGGITDAAVAGAKQASEESAYLKSMYDDQKNRIENEQKLKFMQNDELKAQETKLRALEDEAAAAAKIDPHRFWSSRSTGQKIMAFIGMALGGSDAVANIDRAIDRDIEQQKTKYKSIKEKQGLEENLYNKMLKRFENEQQAQAATRLSLLGIVDLQLKKIESQYKSPIALARAQQARGEIAAKRAEALSQFQSAAQFNPAMSGMTEMAQKIQSLPKDRQAKAYEEVGQYRAIESNLKRANDIFDQMSGLGMSAKLNPLDTRASTLKAELFPVVKGIVGEAMQEADIKRMLEPFMTDKIFMDDKSRKAAKDGLIKTLRSKIPEKTPILSEFGIIPKVKELTIGKAK